MGSPWSVKMQKSLEAHDKKPVRESSLLTKQQWENGICLRDLKPDLPKGSPCLPGPPGVPAADSGPWWGTEAMRELYSCYWLIAHSLRCGFLILCFSELWHGLLALCCLSWLWSLLTASLMASLRISLRCGLASKCEGQALWPGSLCCPLPSLFPG